VSLEEVPQPTPLNARARACRAYAGIKEKALAEATGIEPPRMRRILRPSKPAQPTMDELTAIAEACGVPHVFVELGFAALPGDEPDITERVQALEAKMDTVLDIIGTRVVVATEPPGHGTAGQGHVGGR
jgi:transcriptional regulator with XRE-family HTH domain